MVEHKTTEANKSVEPLACPWINVSCPYAWSMPLLAQASLNVGCSTPYAACAGYSGGRRTGLPRQTVMKSCQVRACYHGGRPEWPQCSWRASHGAAISTPSCGRLGKSPVTDIPRHPRALESFLGGDTISSAKEETLRPSSRPALPPPAPPYRTHILDHLGRVAGMVDELGIGDILDQATHHNPETRDLTVGEAVKAMVLSQSSLLPCRT